MVATETRPRENDVQLDPAMRFQPQLYYVACPYRAGSAALMKQRLGIASAASAALLADGYYAFSPLSHSVAIEDDLGAYDWLPLDLAILGRCDGVIVLTLPGWRSSDGVGREIALAEIAGIPVLYAVARGGKLIVANRPPANDKDWRNNWLTLGRGIEWVSGRAAIEFESSDEIKMCGFCGEGLTHEHVDKHIIECW